MNSSVPEMLSLLYEYAARSFEEVGKTYTGIDIKQSDSFIISSPSIVSAVVGVSGANGRIILTTAFNDAKNIATCMNFGDPVENEDDVFIYLAEFANVYSGRVVTYMNDKFKSRKIIITPPSIFLADDLKVISPNMVSQKAYYQTEIGNFIIDVGSAEEEDEKEEEDDFGF